MHSSLLASVRSGRISDQMQMAADAEGLDAETIRRRIAEGQFVLPMGGDFCANYASPRMFQEALRSGARA